MRNMSYALTKSQLLTGTKKITRRLGWENLRPGERYRAVEKSMGLKKGESVVILCICQCIENRREPLWAITQQDVIDEGFPELTPEQFIAFFCKANKCLPTRMVSRIVFRKMGE